VQIFVPRERAPGETRVAATPETVARLTEQGHEVVIERGAGARAHLSDDAYLAAGARAADDLTSAWANADVILKVRGPRANDELASGHEADAAREGALLIALCSPWREAESVRRLCDRGVSALAMELVPRITRAQSMDALSSQASIAGYKAALIAASHADKLCPLMMTAAGTLNPARVVVLGAGVAGLSALATCRRLGATVEVSDVREEAKEQVESLGGRFIELPMREAGAGEGGYAKEMSTEFLRKQREIVGERIRQADAVITTALVPGKQAPILVDEETVKRMREGAVIVDLAAEAGGNCALSVSGETVERHGVTIVAHPSLATTVPLDASVLYARNVAALLAHVIAGGEVRLELEDPIVSAALLTHAHEVLHAATRASMDGREKGEPR
jgi:NAD(P) transhydrogenase subunit alpha